MVSRREVWLVGWKYGKSEVWSAEGEVLSWKEGGSTKKDGIGRMGVVTGEGCG